MDRRTFLIRVGAGMVAVPAVLTLKACGDDGETTIDSGLPDAAEEDAATGEDSFQGVTSVPHGHTVTVQCADLGEDGVTYTSSFDLMHSHQVVFTGAELAMLAAGEQVMVQTSDGGHDHTWAVQMPAGRCD
jgi:hypothetical protein